jgi:hypothetical protein
MKVMIIILLGFLSSCHSPTGKDKEKQDPQQPEAKPISPINCYQYADKGDTISLKLIHAGESITGALVYKLKEKDSNKGTIQGTMRNNILVADYTFMSEGMQSTRQVAFKLEGNSFIEGYGDSFHQDDKSTFKSLDSLTFNSSFKLAEVPCQ